MHASWNERTSVVEILLENGANLEAKNEFGKQFFDLVSLVTPPLIAYICTLYKRPERPQNLCFT